MATITETSHAGEFIITEPYGVHLRETVTLVSGQSVVAGEVLGVITVGGKYAVFDQDASDGTEDAAAIAYDACDASSADADCVVITKKAVVRATDLTWPSDLEEGELTAATVQLNALDIYLA